MQSASSKFYNFLTASKPTYEVLKNERLVAEILTKINTTNTSLAMGVPTLFVLDQLEKKYLTMSPTVKSLTGFSSKYFMDGGVDLSMSRYDPQGLQIYFGDIYFRNIEFLRNQPVQNHSSFCFSYNYKFKAKDGCYRTILQKMTIIQSAADGVPLYLLFSATDITHYSNKNKIIHTIQNLENPESLVYKKVYFLNEEDAILSAREIEILKWVSEGLSSKQIADKLFLSIHTIHNHRKNILEKCNSANSADLMRYAVQNGLL
ncbi:MAG: helix-turn-helix transcriptional regulator [Cyclobacteriaceae bacterium]|nr:helix-turn-helix transcriptional regulator [Cyclobacteriaceae bacterium]